jgi:uncharacterized protein YjbI with pentapeptide repeats
MSTAWEQLIRGRPLDDLGIAKIDGRLDLRNIHVADPYPVKKMASPVGEVTFLGGITDLKNARWLSIDFSGSQLSGLRLSDSEVQNCLFDRCRMHDLRVWRTAFSNVSFRGADLREAVLGGTSESNTKRNSFHNVDFTGADMRRSIYSAAEFVNCRFDHARLEKVDFESSAFTDCSFAGEMDEVIFNRVGFRCERFPPNEMKRVDFRRAKLHYCEFRGLDLDDVLFPEDDNHIVIDGYPEVLDRLLAFFRGRFDLPSQKLVGKFEHHKRWLGSRQRVGILNGQDLRGAVGGDHLRTVLEIIGAARRPPVT